MRLLTFLILAFVSILAFLLFNIGTPEEVAAVIFSGTLFSLPGFPIYSALLGYRNGKNLETIVFGSTIGICVSCFVTIMIGYFVVWNAYAVVVGLLILSGASYVLQRKFLRCGDIQIKWTKDDFSILFMFLIIVSLSIMYPFLNVGMLTNRGFAYAHLFGHDFILRISFAASIAHGIPPDYLNFTGTILPTYWLFYAFPAFVYMLLRSSSSLQNIMLLTQVFCALIFTAVLFCALRIFLKKKVSIILSMFVCLCAYSYYDFYVLFQSITGALPGNLTAIINMYGLAQLSGISHSVFRNFLFEPQAVLVLSLALIIAVLMFPQSPRIFNKNKYPLVGLLMGLSLGIDAFMGIIIVLWCSAILGGDLFLKAKKGLMAVLPALESFAILVAIFLSYYLIEMYTMSSANSGLLIKPYTSIILMLPFYYILDFGPACIFAFLGIVTLRERKDKSKYVFMVLLVLITLFVSLLVRHSIELNLGLRKGGYVLYIPLIIFSGVFFDSLELNTNLKGKAWILVLVALLAALPTLFTDIISASNVRDKKKTTYVYAADHKACQWIRTNTPPNAVVQSEPEYPSPYEYSLIACFGERAMVISESKRARFVRIPNIEKIAEERKRDVRRIFETDEIGSTVETIRKYGIDFIYLGPYERTLYPRGSDKFDKHPKYFEKVYSANGVNVYRTCLWEHL